ncbi:MAG: 2-C-methyl-D-erythritol 4-phosphate cytidylyltransferase [Chloroflexi bacterium]|nr:2-C-methyl-D-erythritol 4-phosphate cytidylyltransferase [Chloroflexota bacterium]
MNNQSKVGAVIVAAGESRRMGGLDKMLLSLGGEPVLLRATRPFQQCSLVHQIVIVVGGNNENRCRVLVTGEEWSKVSNVCLGGRRRQDSVAAGLSLLDGCGWVIVHDGARPLVTADIIARGLEAARETGAAIAAVPVTDTIKLADDDNLVRQTLPREKLWAAQTPQVFRVDIITEAYRQAQGDVTDDAALVEQVGHRVKLYMGSYDNIKITRPDDLDVAVALWQRRNS